MKKIVILMLSSFLVFTACAKSESNDDTKKEMKEDTGKQTRDENEIVDYEGYQIPKDHIYESISPEELDELLTTEDNMYVLFGRST